MEEEIEISYLKPYFYIDLKDKEFKTDNIELLKELASNFMIDLLWGEKQTVLDDMVEEGGNYSTEISSDEAGDIVEFLENKLKEESA